MRCELVILKIIFKVGGRKTIPVNHDSYYIFRAFF